MMVNGKKKPALVIVILTLSCIAPILAVNAKREGKLRFRQNGEFKILQVADMHYANGKTTPCLDVLPSQVAGCSDLNTTAFINRMISAEKPDLIVFTGTLFSFLPLFPDSSDYNLKPKKKKV